ncbi:MAG: hypothetical protein SOW01_06545 [Mediterranea sp.]|nr:hypothetical protein [Mediterranea sp.]
MKFKNLKYTLLAALKKLYPEINWQTGKLLNHVSEQDMKAWCNKIGLSAL